MLAEVLDEYCAPTLHLDASKLILTNDAFRDAEPRYWETYARIRWSVPVAARDKLVVVGGFIGSTEDGRTTTLGRGGSDLTASIMGAAINADEVQVWKDVDGMLTCDPRIFPDCRQVRRLSYQEATELAESGATILHPKTMEPAKRLRIPIAIRNTFRPDVQGTRIEDVPSHAKNVVKSLAIKEGVSLLEIQAINPNDSCEALIDVCKRLGSAATVLSSTQRSVYVSLDENAKRSEECVPASASLQVRMKSRQAIITLVGESLDTAALSKNVSTALQGISAFVIPNDQSTSFIRCAVPLQHLKRCVGLLHRAFFAHADLDLFGAANTESKAQPLNLKAGPRRQSRMPESFVPFFALIQSN
jgi:aspartate kinase